jgi:MoxR-like ATPase
MKALISASNELPAKDQGLEALWDRFLVRLIVNGIEDKDEFNKMIAMSSTLFDEKVDGSITDNEYKEWSKKIDQIVIPDNVFNVIQVIRNKIELHKQNEENTEKQIYVSDRRWRKIIKLMRTSAFLNDREEVDLMDCFLIKHCIWSEEWQIQTVSGFVNDAIREHGPSVDMNLSTKQKEFARLKTEIENRTSKEVGKKLVVKQNVIGKKFYRLVEKIIGKYLFISCDEVDKITGDQDTYIFTEDFSTSCKYNIKKGEKENSIVVRESSYYNNWTLYNLKTEPVNKPYKESPKRTDYKVWNEETENLLSVLTEKKAEAEKYWSEFSESFYDNQFVKRDSADKHIKSKIDEVIEDIENLMMDIKDVCNKYQSIYKPNE